MEEKHKKIIDKLIKYKQEDILKTIDKFSNEEKENILNQIENINFEQLEKLYKKIDVKKEDKCIKIEPIEYIEKENISIEEKEKYNQIGTKTIKEEKYAVVTMAGGQGTRLGHNGPKGTFDFGLDSHKSIFEILCENLKEAYEKYKIYVPWYIMTSKENNKETKEFFEKNNFFDYPREKIIFFTQEQLPMLNEKGKLIIDENKDIKQAADGHGGIFVSMRKDNIVEDMKKRNIEWVYIGGVDNILAKMVDSVFVGLAIEQKVLAAGKSAVKACPEEKVGVFCKKNGKPSVVEYSEITKEMSEERDVNGQLKFGESHLLCNLFNIDAIDEISKDKLPYHAAYKKCNYINNNGELIIVDKPNAYKFEAFLFDAFESLDKITVLRVRRKEEFAPIKNAEGKDSPETARELYNKFHKIGG
ncbi:MAG: hypothetical protein GX682_05350 [Clostridiaceae bacterium]|nr:hypothetical protein [Clostridiaceae bacterium]